MSQNKLPNNLRCPICQTPIDFVKQIYEWDMYYGDDVDGDSFINIMCEKCGKPRLSVFIEGLGMELPDELQVKLAKDMKKIKKEKN